MKLKIYFSNEQNKEEITYGLKILCRRAVEVTLACEAVDKPCEVSITFTDNENIHELNSKFRGVDRPTDVLSFPLTDAVDGALPEDFDGALGDIVLSLERAREQSEEFGHSFAREVAFLTVHSVLHLLGYDHERGEAEDADMRRRQSHIVEKLGLSVKK